MPLAQRGPPPVPEYLVFISLLQSQMFSAVPDIPRHYLSMGLSHQMAAAISGQGSSQAMVCCLLSLVCQSSIASPSHSPIYCRATWLTTLNFLAGPIHCPDGSLRRQDLPTPHDIIANQSNSNTRNVPCSAQGFCQRIALVLSCHPRATMMLRKVAPARPCSKKQVALQASRWGCRAMRGNTQAPHFGCRARWCALHNSK
jgi:hypothetical protein